MNEENDHNTAIAVMRQKIIEIERRLGLIEGNTRWLVALVAASVIGAVLRVAGVA